jgi:AraC-like DNA-binding protein
MYDRDGNLWMGCLDGDLVERTAAGWCYYPIRNVQDIVQLPDGIVAVATVDGIKRISKSNGQLGELDYSSVSDNVNRYVLSLFVNDNRELWIGTDGGGAYVYNLSDRSCIQLTKDDGLPSNVVCSFAKDFMGRIHIATEEGLAFVNPNSHSSRPQVYCMNYGYGIEREYSARAAANLPHNQLFFGTTTGALILNPANMQELNYEARLRLVGVGCADAESDRFARYVHEMLARRELQLDYAQRTFDLYIESVNLRNQFDIVYQYKIAGGEWSQPSNQQTIRFTNMASGTHELILRCVSRTCGTVLDELTLTLVVAQPWWNSWWMWVVYVCLILLAFYGAWRVYQLHDKYMRLVVSDLNQGAENAEMAGITKPSPVKEAPSAAVIEDSDATPESNEKEPHEVAADGSEFIARVTKLVADNLADTEFNIDRLCREMAMSRTLFYIKLKTYTGKSPQDFIRIIRLERAAALLRSGRAVTDTALLTGFDNPKYFSTVFKKYFGVSPSKYA